MPWLALKGLGSILGSTKFLVVMCIVCALVFAKIQVGNYIDHEIKQNTTIVSQKYENESLKFQMKVMKDNQAIVKDVEDKTIIIREGQKAKSESTRKKIDEDIKNGNDGFVGPLLTNVIDGL